MSTKPALAPEQWTRAINEKVLELPGPKDQTRVVVDTCGDIFTLCFYDWEHFERDGFATLEYEGWLNSPEQRHSLAALCLHMQPCGFTHEDLAQLRMAMNMLVVHHGDVRTIRSIYDRIEALLPPRETSHDR